MQPDFYSLGPLKETDQAWYNCFDSYWTTVTQHEQHDLSKQDYHTWELFLRMNYCKDIREGAFFEYVMDAPYFKSADNEPEFCMA